MKASWRPAEWNISIIYLMHAQNAREFVKFKECQAYETAFQLKAEGKVRHVGISFHDRAELLEQILTEYPQVEVVQIQFNYVDYDDLAVQSRRCYEVCREARQAGDRDGAGEGRQSGEAAGKRPGRCWTNCTAAAPPAMPFASRRVSRALQMVLSGMSSLEQMRDNISFMTGLPARWTSGKWRR